MAKKKENKEQVRCIDCEKSALLQWDNNPIIAHCHISSFPNVANTPRFCTGFKPRISKNPQIRKLTHFK